MSSTSSSTEGLLLSYSKTLQGCGTKEKMQRTPAGSLTTRSSCTQTMLLISPRITGGLCVASLSLETWPRLSPHAPFQAPLSHQESVGADKERAGAWSRCAVTQWRNLPPEMLWGYEGRWTEAQGQAFGTHIPKSYHT